MSIDSDIAVRSFTAGYLKVTVYQNTRGPKVYLDTVIYRRVGRDWRRGANLKPVDLPVLRRLLNDAIAYITNHPRYGAVPATHTGSEVQCSDEAAAR